MLILIGLQIYIIAAAYSTNYVQQARTDFLALWADQRRSIERIAYLEQKVNPEREYELEFDTIIYNLPLQYACCGQNGAHDYILQGGGIPVTCYRNLERIQIHLFGEGCLDAVEAHAEDNVINGLIVKWLLFVVEASMMTLGKIIIYDWISRSKNRFPPDIHICTYVCVYTLLIDSLSDSSAH